MTARLPIAQWLPAAGAVLISGAIGILAGVAPAAAIVASLGLVFVLVIFVDLAAGLVILTLVAFAETTPLAGPALSFTKLVGLLLALAYLARIATQPADRERIVFTDRPWLSMVLVGLAAWSAVSITWASSVPDALSEALGVLLVVVLFAIVFTAVDSRRHAVWVIGAFVAASALTAAYGLVFQPVMDVGASGRLSSTIQDPNAFAQTLIAGLTLGAAGFAAAPGQLGVRLAAATCFALCLTAFFLTGSRGGLVALVVVLATAVTFGGRWRGRLAIAAVLLVSGAVIYYSYYASAEIRDRLAAATQGEVEEESRVTIWTTGWRMVQDNPVHGVGIGNFQEESIHYVLQPGGLTRTERVIDQPAAAHNTYLQVLAELGVIGATLFLGVIALSVASAVTATRIFERNGDWRMGVLARGLVCTMLGVLASNVFISETFSKVPWLVLALGPAFLAIARAEDSTGDAQIEGGSVPEASHSLS